MTVYFGVDSASPAQTVAANVEAFAGSLPSWWARYLGADVLSADEASWLHANGIRILPVWNALSAGDVASNQAHGVEHGQRAAAAAKDLGVPAGVPIPVDVETEWLPTAEFLAGYGQGLRQGGYLDAAYCNILVSAHVAAWRGARQLTGFTSYLWSSEPEYTSWAQAVRTEWTDFAPFLGTDADAVLWHQYGENQGNGTFDINIATQQGYDLLWKPPVPAPPPVAKRMCVAKMCGLKPHPKSGGGNVAMIPAHGEILDTGKIEGPYTYVEWAGHWGWILSSNIVPL